MSRATGVLRPCFGIPELIEIEIRSWSILTDSEEDVLARSEGERTRKTEGDTDCLPR